MTRPAAAAGSPARPDLESRTPYAQWVRGEGLDGVGACEPFDLRSVGLKTWARRGGQGIFVRHAELPVAADCYVCEIPPGQSLAPQRHLFEEVILVLSGRGTTSFCTGGGAIQSFEWKAGTLFSVPLNATYRHFNGSGQQGARFVAVTTAPQIIDAFADRTFVFDCRHDFSDRVLATMEFGPTRTIAGDGACGLDALDCPLMDVRACGAGGHLHSTMATHGLSIWISQLPPGTYGKAHAYGPDAYSIVLAGGGYSSIWPESGGERTRWSWREDALLHAPSGWWRQHFNPGPSPARLVTLMPNVALRRRADGTPRIWISAAHGGACIDYADEAADVRAAFAVALSESGVASRMSEVYALAARNE